MNTLYCTLIQQQKLNSLFYNLYIAKQLGGAESAVSLGQITYDLNDDLKGSAGHIFMIKWDVFSSSLCIGQFLATFNIVQIEHYITIRIFTAHTHRYLYCFMAVLMLVKNEIYTLHVAVI